MKKMLFVWQYLGKTLQEFKVMLLGYRVYRVRLVQTGTDAPVATELENTLHVTAEYFYDNDGTYSIVFNRDLFMSPLDADINVGNNYMVDHIAGSTFSIQAFPSFFNELAIETFKGTAYTNGVLGFGLSAPNVLEIRVYNN